MNSGVTAWLKRSWPVGTSLLLHGLLLFGVIPLGYEAAQYGIASGQGADSVTTLQAEVRLESPPPEPEPEPESLPEPEPEEPQEKVEKIPQPEPKPKPEPKPEPEVPTPKKVVKEPKPSNTPASTASSPKAKPTASRARVVNRVNYLRNPPPSYPSSAKRRGIEGTVHLAVDISASGRVEQVRIRSRSGNDALDRAALDAVKRWRFRPARVAGKKVPSRAVIPIVFQLD